jgi:hypothetical protein
MEVRCCGRTLFGADGCLSLSVECLCCAQVWLASICFLMRSAAGNSVVFRVVDVYNGYTWSTAQLSVARYGLGATSVGRVALFAGGYDGSALLSMEGV